MLKKTIALVVTLLCILTLVPAAFASDLMEDGRFYSKQDRSRTCTLASAAMMLRRRAYLDGNEAFSEMTESDLRSTAWYNGLSHNFTYKGMTVAYGSLSGTAEQREQALAALLAEHPEGIVAYDRSRPHAILLTDYTDGMFYCADPANGTGYGRMPVAYASIELRRVSGYWYVSADENVPYGTGEVDGLTLLGVFYPENVRTGAGFNLGGLRRGGADDTILQVEIQILAEDGSILQYAAALPDEGAREWSFRALNRDIRFSTLADGVYTFYVVAQDSAGGTLTFVRQFTVSGEGTHTLYYWSNKPVEAAA